MKLQEKQFFIKKQSYKGEQIIKNVSLKDKITTILPSIDGKTTIDLKHIHQINNLINLRHLIIHPKKSAYFEMKKYDELYNTCLSHNYSLSLESVKEVINFYSENDLIAQCNCGKDY